MTGRKPEYDDKWFFVVFAVIVLTLFLAKFARADEAPATAPSSAPAAVVVPLPAGVAAPFDGLLVPESIFIEYMRQEIRITELTMKLDLRDRLLAKPLVTKRRRRSRSGGASSLGWGWSGDRVDRVRRGRCVEGDAVRRRMPDL
jgi:hypothetical protein